METDEEEGFGMAMVMGSETTEAEKEFEKVLEELRDSEGLKRISDVYTKLYDTYNKLKDELGQKNENLGLLQNKLDRFDDNLSGYMKELKDAHSTIEKQKLEIEEARALADAMHARELASVESFETIKKSVIRLEKELEARKRAGEEEAGPTSAVKEKEKFEKEKIRLTAEADNLRFRLDTALRIQEELEQKSSAADAKITELSETIEEQENNAVRQNRLVEHLKNESTRLKHEIESKEIHNTTLQEKLNKTEKTLDRRDKQIKEMTTKLETAKNEHDHATHIVTQLKEELRKTNVALEQTKQQFINTSRELKSSISDGNRLRNEMAKLTKQTMRDTKRFQLIEGVKGTLEMDRDRLRQQVTIMERELAISRKQTEADHREIENLQREKDIMNKNMQKIQMEAMENLQMLALQEHKRKTLEHEIDANIHYIAKQRNNIRTLEKLKDRMMEETIALNEKIDDITDEVRLRNSDILELKKGLSEELIRTRKLTVSLDTIRAERNMLHKNYTEALDEILDLKQKLKMLAYQIEQLKEDLGCKESNLKSCEAALGKCNKKCEQLRTEIQNQQVRLSEARADIAALKQEEARLNRIVQDGDIAKAKLIKELEGLMNERDVVGAQLVRRNDEISLLYEKIRILEITLQRGERQYEQRQEDIRLLRLEILRLRKEKNLLSKGIENMTDLRLEVFNLERELGRERLRVRALEEALETPLNVHRWRKLQGTDPESVQLTQKLRLTQKKVLAQSEMLVLKDRELKETRNLYSAVKDMLALQPSPEVKQTLTRTQRALAARTSKMKCLIAELNMREHQLSDLRLELDRVTSDLHTFKQRYYDMKRALDADEARRLRVPSPLSPPRAPIEIETIHYKEAESQQPQRASVITEIVLATS